MWWLVVIVIIAVICGFGFLVGKDQAEVSLKIATFDCDIQVYNLRLGYDDFWIYVDFEDGSKIQFSGNTIGEIQFKISKMCKLMAQKRDGVDFNKFNKDYYRFTVGVEKDGQLLTMSQYVNLTTSAMRSTKNPIVGYHHSDGFEPMWGPSDYPIREKL